MSAVSNNSVLEDFFISSAKQKEEASKYKSSNDGMQVSSDQFLQLLVCQMSNQDPMNPMQDTEMMAQYAQLQQLENQQTMTSAMTDMRKEYAVQGAGTMIGKVVTATDKTGETITGIAVKVSYSKSDNSVQLELSNGTKVNYTDITSVEQNYEGVNINASSNMIGKFIIGIDENARAYQGVVKNATTNGSTVYLETYDGVYVPLEGVAQVRDLTPSETEKLNAALALVDKYVEAPQNNGKILSGVVKGIYSKNGQYWAQTWGGSDIYVGNVTEKRELTTSEFEDMENAKRYVNTYIKANGGQMVGIAEGFFYKEGKFYLYTARGEVCETDSVYYSRDFNSYDSAVYTKTDDISDILRYNIDNCIEQDLGKEFTGYSVNGDEVSGVVSSVYLRNGMLMLGLTDEEGNYKEAVSPFSLFMMGQNEMAENSSATGTSESE